LALFCNVNLNSVIQARDCESIYDVPLEVQKENLDKIVLAKFRMSAKQEVELTQWKDFLFRLKNPKTNVKIGLIGKYVELQDAYKSILESFTHAGASNECRVTIESIHSEDITEGNVEQKLKGLHGILVAPGFGNRGIEGKIIAIRYVREHKIPFFGICLGMQCAVVEFARNVLGLKEASSTELDKNTPFPVISMMEEQKHIVNMGGTMRLGAYPCELKDGSLVGSIYPSKEVSEVRKKWLATGRHQSEERSC
jgi:CTP synthase